MDSTFDKLFYDKGKLIAGVDESGVIDIAGPLVSACVVLPRIDLHKDDLRIFEVEDCKKIPEKKRKYYAEIIWQTAYAIGIGIVNPEEIDYFGRQASIRISMVRSIEACKRTTTKRKVVPDYLLIDGEWDLPINTPYSKFIEGDTKSLSIASASIIAKVYRDDEMVKLHKKYPHYDWINNKGFPCKKHFEGMDENGIIIGVHRVNTWPLSQSSKYKPDGIDWKKRRKEWKKRTENTLINLRKQET